MLELVIACSVGTIAIMICAAMMNKSMDTLNYFSGSLQAEITLIRSLGRVSEDINTAVSKDDVTIDGSKITIVKCCGEESEKTVIYKVNDDKELVRTIDRKKEVLAINVENFFVAKAVGVELYNISLSCHMIINDIVHEFKQQTSASIRRH